MKLITIDHAVDLILKDKIVAVPTETVYGLFGLANSPLAVQSVYYIKNRPADNPLICHFYSLNQILEYVQTPPGYICKLIELIGPNSLTYLLKLQPNSPLSPACANLQTICCRIPANPLALELLRKTNVPLFGPSANTSTKVSGVTVQMIDQDLGEKIAGIIEGGQCQIGLESTIIDTLENNKIKILRPGLIGKTELQNYLNQIGFDDIEVIENQKSESTTPGAKYRHYSPKTKIYLAGENISHLERSERSRASIGKIQKIIGLKEFQSSNPNFISLGSKKDLLQASADFYVNLYQLDQQNIESCTFDRQSFEFIRDSQLSIAKALFNRLEKVLV